MAIPWKAVAIGGVGLLLLGGGAYAYGGAPKKQGVDRDPKKLLKPFAKKLNILFSAMRARGYQPVLWEGRRSTQRAAELGYAKSLHTLGAAADIVDGSSSNPWKAKAGFWAALGEESAKLGLTWGGDWVKRDLPHVQAIAVNKQAAFRRMTPADRASLIA